MPKCRGRLYTLNRSFEASKDAPPGSWATATPTLNRSFEASKADGDGEDDGGGLPSIAPLRHRKLAAQPARFWVYPTLNRSFEASKVVPAYVQQSVSHPSIAPLRHRKGVAEET